MEAFVKSISREFSDGFFYTARLREFNPVAGQRVIEILRAIQPRPDWADNRDIIEQIWKLPFYACAYRERCLENGANPEEYDYIVAEISSIVSQKMADMLMSKEGNT